MPPVKADPTPINHVQRERVAYYVVAVPYFGAAHQSPDKAVARALALSVGANVTATPVSTKNAKAISKQKALTYKA